MPPEPTIPTSTPAHRVGGGIAQVVGILIFLAGLAMLIYVFQSANALLNQPIPVIAAPATPPTANAPNAALQIGNDFAGFLRRLLVLLLLCIVGGTVSSVGINLFFKARKA